MFITLEKKNMNKILLALSVTMALSAHAQSPLSSANCDVTLTVQGTGGTNGVSVSYNPVNKVYYTAFAGNQSYPLEIHDMSGKSISTQECGYDLRGLWYNPKAKMLQGISYNNQGSFDMKISADGTLKGSVSSTFSYGMGAQSVGSYAAKMKSVMFVEGNTVSFFKVGTTKVKTVTLSPSNPNVELNTNGPMYTGVKNHEIALFDGDSKSVYLFSAKTGKQTGKVLLNTSACGDIYNVPGNFRVSYANDRVFLFDTDSRSWKGFSIFD